MYHSMFFILIVAIIVCGVSAFHLNLGRLNPIFRSRDGSALSSGFNACLPTHGVAQICVPAVAAHPMQNSTVAYYEANKARPGFLRALRQLLVAYAARGMERGLSKSDLIKDAFPKDFDRVPNVVFKGLMQVVNVEFLQSLHSDDPRRDKLSRLVYPDPELRAELEQRLLQLDEYLFAESHIRTRSLYETVARLGWNGNVVFHTDDFVPSKRYTKFLARLMKRADALTTAASEEEAELFWKLLEFLKMEDDFYVESCLAQIEADLPCSDYNDDDDDY